MVQLVRVAGTPYERGARLGEALADSVAGSVAFNRRYLAAHAVGRDALERLLEPYLDASVATVPHLVQQVRGMADGAGQPFLDLFFANAFEEVYGIVEPAGDPVERCTVAVLRGPGRTLLGHNEQWYAGDDGTVGMVLDVSDDGPALLAPVVAGTLPLVGLNEHGAAFGTMSLSARDERVGVPRALVAREVLDARDPADAFARRASTCEPAATRSSAPSLVARPVSSSRRRPRRRRTRLPCTPTTRWTPRSRPLRASRRWAAGPGWRAPAPCSQTPRRPSTGWRGCSPTTAPRARTSASTPTRRTVTRARRSSSR